MNDHSFRFNIGTFECIAVSDGISTYSVAHLFANAPQDQLERVLDKHHLPSKYLNMPYICLVINVGDHWVLVDTGGGAGKLSSTGKLLQNLAAEGIAPTDVDTVILSHGHGDHGGGSADSQGRPAFPRARYVMNKDEWDFWTSEANLIKMGWHSSIPYVRQKLLPLRDQLDLIEKETEILPGVRAIPAVGHTPGHMVVTVSSGQEKLWFTGDALIHPLHLEHPGWYSAFDIRPKQAAATMRRLLEQITAEKALVFAYHYPFPGLGHVVQKGDAWQWQPLAG